MKQSMSGFLDCFVLTEAVSPRKDGGEIWIASSETLRNDGGGMGKKFKLLRHVCSLARKHSSQRRGGVRKEGGLLCLRSGGGDELFLSIERIKASGKWRGIFCRGRTNRLLKSEFLWYSQ